MRSVKDREFKCWYDHDTAASFCNIEFHRCYFESCAVSITKDPALRSTVRNIQFIDCSQRGCSLDPAIVEDCLIDGFKTHGQVFQTFGAVFKHVTLRGKIDDVMISNDLPPDTSVNMVAQEQVPDLFRAANAEYYREVDWALDISQAQFKDCDIRGIAARLIRRDPDTQFVVTRERAMEGGWKKLKLHETLWMTWIKCFLESNESDVVLVAPKRHAKFKRYLEDLQLLRKAGIAEPD